MDFGICLPNFPAGASPEGLEAAASVAERLGWSTIWTTDHVLVTHASAREYGRIYEALTTLAWLGARHPSLRLGTSIIVVPQRNAVLLAKELATLDSLSGGRVTAGIGGGWSRDEFANLGVADRFAVRGAYVEETIGLWRHLWSGSRDPFHGRFHSIDDFEFEPLPDQGAGLPILLGGRAEPALRRAGRLADGYHASSTPPAQWAPRVPVIAAAAEAAGRPMPPLSGRVRVDYAGRDEQSYALRGTPEEMAVDVTAYADIGLSHLALWFETTDATEIVAHAERFAAEVAPLVA